MPYTAKPHVSAALVHLRHAVTACVLVVAAAAATQMLVFGCVHFTQSRFQEEVRRDASNQALSVVSAPRQVSGPKHQAGPGPQPVGPSTQAPPPEPETVTAVHVPRPLSTTDATLHVLSDLAAIGGTLATVAIAVLALLAVAVAGGAAVPGVDRVVSAAGFALLLALGCIPWREVFSFMPFPGVFSGYETMTELSDAVNAGGQALPLFTMYLLMPSAALIGAFLVLARFRAGVAEGVIVTSVSELDARLDREMAGIAAKGVAAVAPRAVAALNHAIGEQPEAPPPPPEQAAESAPRRIPGMPMPRPSSSGRSMFGRERRIGETDPGDPLKRPI